MFLLYSSPQAFEVPGGVMWLGKNPGGVRPTAAGCVTIPPCVGSTCRGSASRARVVLALP